MGSTSAEAALLALFICSIGFLAQAQECGLAFYFRLDGSPQSDRVIFTGLTTKEVVESGNTTVGHRLTCACTTIKDLTPLQWLDVNGQKVTKNTISELVDYKPAPKQPGSAVHLRINKDGFSCAEAGSYTCVVGTNTRSVLVTPIDQECGPVNVAVTTSPPGPVSIGTNLTLQCSADDPTNSNLTYKWLMNGIQIRGEFSPTLILGVAGPEDGGTYTCRVSNRAGQGEANVIVEVIEISSPTLSTPVEVTNTLVEVMSTLVEVMSTPVEVTGTPVEVTNTPMEVMSTQLEVTRTPVEVMSTPVEVTSTPVEVMSTQVEVMSTPVEVTSTTVEVMSTQVEVMSTPVEVTSTPVEVMSTPMEVMSTQVEVTSSPVEVTSTPVEVMSTQVEVTSTPVEVMSTPVEVTSTTVEVMSTLVEVMSTPVEVTSTPVEVTSTTVEVTNTQVEVMSTLVEVMSTPVEVTSIQVEVMSTPVEVTSTPVEVTSTPVEVMSTQVEVTRSPVEVTSIPVEVMSTQVEVMSTPVEVTSTPVEVTSAPVKVVSTQVEVTSTPVQVMSSLVEVTSIPLKVMSTPLQVTSIPVGVTSVPIEVTATTVEVIATLGEESSTPVEATFTSVKVRGTSVEMTPTPVAVTSIVKISVPLEVSKSVPSSPVSAVMTLLSITSIATTSFPSSSAMDGGFVFSTSVIVSDTPGGTSSAPVGTSSTPVSTSSAPVGTSSTPVSTSSTLVGTSSTPVMVLPSTYVAAPSSAKPSISPSPSPSVDPRLPADVSVPLPTVTDGAVSITLMWSKPTLDMGLTGYNVQYSWESMWDPNQFVKRQSELKTMSVNVSNTSYTVQDAEGFAEYCFEVSALYEGGVESPAAPKECTSTPETKPSPPQNLSQVGGYVTTSSVRLHWDAPDTPNGNIILFKVYYQSGRAARQYQVSDWYGQEYVVLDGLDPSTEYYINVTAVTVTESDTSNGLRVTTLPDTGGAAGSTSMIWIVAVILIALVIVAIFVLAVGIRLFVLVNRHCDKESEKAHKYFSVELKERGEQEKDAEGTNDDEEDHTTLTCYCWGKRRESSELQ